MEACEYETLAAYETWYWWYRAQREALVDAVRHLGLPSGARVLDAGCGTGRNVLELTRTLGLEVYGLDNSVHAAANWNGAGPRRRCMGSVNELPYADGTFDVVTSVDVLPSQQVRPQASLNEMARVTRCGGYVVVLVPAYQWLLSRHDRAVHCVQRFSRPAIRSMAAAADLAIERLTHLFPVFFPVIATLRLAHKRAWRNGSAPVRSDLSPIPEWLNGVLLLIARAEHKLTSRLTVPFGTTILAVGRKKCL